jgi:predicted molibdopterin-dependent oxidoreductase YjgC
MLEAGIMPSDGSKGAVEMLYKSGSLKALYIMGEDPIVNMPDTIKVREILKSLDFLIIQDIDMTETAKLAYVVLPASSWAEKNGSFLNAEGLMQKIQKVVETTGQSLPDWMILRNLGLSMGADLGVKSLDDLTKEVEGLVSQKEKGDVKPTFHPTSYDPEEAPDSEFNYTLVTRDMLQHSGNMSTRSEALRLVNAEPFLEMNKKDAEKHAIIDEEHVKITSRRGSVYLRVKVIDTVPEGVVVTSVHFPHGELNELTHLSKNDCSRLDTVKIERWERII